MSVQVFKQLGIHPSWFDLFTPLFATKQMSTVRKVLKHKFIPSQELVFRVFKMNVYDIKVVILGKEPSLGSNGLAYSNTQDVKILLNEVEKTFYLQDFNTNRLDLIDYSLERWETQGIFLLNTSLTKGKESHTMYWDFFIRAVVDYITEVNPSAIWLDINQTNLINNQDYVLTELEGSFDIIQKHVFHLNGEKLKL
jgi:uracil DNA glycosylase